MYGGEWLSPSCSVRVIRAQGERAKADPHLLPHAPRGQTYSITHQNRPIREQLEGLLEVCNNARDMGFLVRANLQVTIECPYEGAVPPSRVADIAEEMVRMGCFEVSLVDNTGRGDPGTVGRLIREVGDRIGIERVACNVSVET